MKVFKQILTLSLLSCFFACEEVVTIDLEQTEVKLTIDGLLTDQLKTHEVKLTTSIDFYDTDIPPVSVATVEVVDEFGTRYNYTHNPLAVDSLEGIFYSEIPYQGQADRAYTLNVTYNGTTYSATDTLKRVTSIDSLAIQLDQQAVNDDENDGMIYQVVLFADEPDETDDFYFFKFYRDSVREDSDQIYAFDDRTLGSSLDGLPSPILFREGELAGVEIYSLTREQYIFYVDLANILNGDGGLFAPPPANPRTNLSNGALGIWQVSGVSEGSILIEP